MATSWTQSDLTKLERAIRTGASTVEYDNGRRVTYRSLEEMFRLRDLIAGEIDPSTRGPLRKVMATSKGLRAPAAGFDDFLP